MSAEFGRFPFGRPNTVRPMRAAAAGPAKVLVVGVYPSAWHVTWSAPIGLAGPGRSGRVQALAVDVEPTVFWSGEGAFAADLDAWRENVTFVEGDDEGCHGRIDLVPPSANGSSGRKVEDRYLRPLDMSADEAAFTDVYPVFVVKGRAAGARKGVADVTEESHAAGKKKSRREQGDAIAVEYDTIAGALARHRSTLPPRPSPKALPAKAARRFAERIVADLEEANAPLVITLGDEAMQTLRRIPALRPQPPVEALTELYALDAYGRREGSLRVNGGPVRWLPLAHPGLLKGKPSTEGEIDPERRSLHGWNLLHSRWSESAGAAQ